MFTDGKPLVYLVDFYLHEYMTSPQYFKQAQVTDHDHELMESFSTEIYTPKYRLAQDVIKHMYTILEFLKIIVFFEGDPSCNDENVIIMLAFLPTLLLEGKLKFKSFAYAQQNSMGSKIFERRVLVEHYYQRKSL